MAKIKIHVFLYYIQAAIKRLTLLELDSITYPAQCLEELRKDTPSLTSIITKVNNFDRRLDVGRIQLSIWVTLKAPATEKAVSAYLHGSCLSVFYIFLCPGDNQQVLIRKSSSCNFFFNLLQFLLLFIKLNVIHRYGKDQNEGP